LLTNNRVKRISTVFNKQFTIALHGSTFKRKRNVDRLLHLLATSKRLNKSMKMAPQLTSIGLHKTTEIIEQQYFGRPICNCVAH